MWYVKVNGETEATAHNKNKAKDKANEIARDMFPNANCASITVENYKGVIHRSIFYDGWNVYTDRSKEK